MALNTRGTSGSNKTFLNIYQGNMVLEYSSREELEKKLDYLGLDPEGIKVRQRTKGKNEGKDVYYYTLNDVSGFLTNIKFHVNDFGEFLELEFSDVDEKYSVSLGDVYSRMSKDFIRRIGNVNLQEELVFGVWNFTEQESDNGKARSGVKMYQDGNKIEYFIEYEELPEPTKKQKGSKTIWNFDDQEEFLYQALKKFVSENFVDESVSEDDAAGVTTEEAKPVRKSRSPKAEKSARSLY